MKRTILASLAAAVTTTVFAAPTDTDNALVKDTTKVIDIEEVGYKIYSAKLPLFPQSLKLQRFIVQPMISVRNLRYDWEIYDCKQESRHRFFCNFVVNFSSPIATYGFAAASKHLIINRLKMAKS